MAIRMLSLLSLLALINACNTRQQVPEGFQLEKGFDMSLVASEPVIMDPVDLEFNERGEAMVLLMPGYPLEDVESRIVVMKDRDGNGQYDTSTVFADHLRLASSFLPYKKGVLVAAPPFLLHLKDLNQDNVADGIDTLMGGFATGNLQHNFNGLTYGIDNWIYAVNGGNSGKPFWWGDTSSVMDLRGQDFRFNLDLHTMERLGESSGGFGLGMDPFGRLYETHNLTHVSHLVFPDRYIHVQQLAREHTLQNVSDHEENGLARIYPIGEQDSRVNHPEQSGYFSGSCGIMHYNGSALGSRYDNTVWVADVVLNLVHVDQLKPNGAAFSASRMMDKREFLASTDRGFRPVNLTSGPDEAIYVLDMHRKVIEHPEWIPDEIEDTLDLDAGKDQGRIYRIARQGFRPPAVNMKDLSHTEGRIRLLSHPGNWLRKTAHRLLMENKADSHTVTLLRHTAQHGNALSRLHARWILAAQHSLTPDLLMEALKDKVAANRENALLMAEGLMDQPGIRDALLTLLQDQNQRVRMQAALSLSTDSVSDSQALSEMKLKALAKSATQKLDDWNIAAITLASGAFSSELFSLLLTENHHPNPVLLASLARQSAQSNTSFQKVLTALQQHQLPLKSQQLIWKGIAASRFDGINGNLLDASLSFLEKESDASILALMATVRKKLHLKPSERSLALSRVSLKQVLDPKRSDSLKLQDMALIGLLPFQEKDNTLFACLRNTEPLQVQEEAMRQLSVERELRIGNQLLAMWPELGPQTRRYAGDMLLYIEMYHDVLLTGLEKGIINIGEMNFDLERRRTLLWWTDNMNTRKRAEALFSDAGVVNRKSAIEKMKPALSLQGDAHRGAAVFSNICANCHVYGRLGKEVGPVLTEISRKSKESILQEIMDPNAAVDTKYINHRLETGDGQIHMGIIAVENDRFVTLKKMGGSEVTVQRKDIKSLRSLGKSLMMEGLEGSINPQQMADLLAFLQGKGS